MDKVVAPSSSLDYTSLPVLNGDEARSIDKAVSEKLGRVRILESVATRIADTIEYHLFPSSNNNNDNDNEEHRSKPNKPKLLFVAGKGNNGANAIACGRILAMRGWDNIHLVLAFACDNGKKESLRPNISEQLELFEHFLGKNHILHSIDTIPSFTNGYLIDGVLGTGIDRPPQGMALEAINAMNANTTCPTISIDIPSGLNHITGQAPGEAVRASITINLHMIKRGQLEPYAKEYIGKQLWSIETGLGYATFPGDLADKFERFYRDGPIRRVY